MDEWMYGWMNSMNGSMDAIRMDRWWVKSPRTIEDGWMVGGMNAWIAWIDQWMLYGWMDVWMDGGMMSKHVSSQLKTDEWNK